MYLKNRGHKRTSVSVLPSHKLLINLLSDSHYKMELLEVVMSIFISSFPFLHYEE